MNRVAILSNAGSGRNRRRNALLRTLDALSGVHHRITRSADEIDEALAELLAPAPAVLAVNGGDGTVQAVLTALERRGEDACPPLAILPAGSTNMTAHDLRCGGPLHARLADLLALRDRPRESWRLAARQPLNVGDDEGGIRVGFFFGLGTIVRGIDFWQRSLARGRGAGEWGAGFALVRAAWGIARGEPPFAEPVRARLGIDGGEPQPRELMFLLVTPMQRLFLGLTPFWGPGPGPLSMTWVDRRPARFVRRIPALLRGRGEQLPEADGFHGCRPGEVVVEPEESWVIDGEVFPACGRLRLQPGRPRRFLELEPPRREPSS